MWEIEKTVNCRPYRFAVVRGHPNAYGHDYILEHRVIMENAIGRLLDKDEVVHHKNGDKQDNRVENLELLTNKNHSRLHAIHDGTLYLKLKCPQCFSVFDRQKRQVAYKRSALTFCSRKCAGEFYTHKTTTHDVNRAVSVNIVSEYRKYLHDNAEGTR